MTSQTFCNRKFDFIQINLHDGVTQSCCHLAKEDRPKLSDVKQVGFFNYPEIVADREKLLTGQQPAGCAGCWELESQGLTSLRQHKKYNIAPEVMPPASGAVPKTVNLVLGNKCLLTCVYCCKKYSHKWAADLMIHGPYELSDKNRDRVTLSQHDRVVLNNKHRQASYAQLAFANIREWVAASALPITFSLSGGEPFLYDEFDTVLTSLEGQDVTISTGLGVPAAVLESCCRSIARHNFASFCVVISAETTGKIFEFVRYGNRFSEFLENIKVLEQFGITYSFNGVISNITAFGLLDFIDMFQHKQIRWSVLSDPDYLKISVLDSITKQALRDAGNMAPGFLETLDHPCTTEQKADTKRFLTEFAARRNLSLDIFPKHFVSWLFN